MVSPLLLPIAYCHCLLLFFSELSTVLAMSAAALVVVVVAVVVVVVVVADKLERASLTTLGNNPATSP